MEGEKKERWMELAEQASTEQDSKKLIELTDELNRLLGEKDRQPTTTSAYLEEKAS